MNTLDVVIPPGAGRVELATISLSRSLDILGYAPEEIIGKVFLNLIHTGDSEKAQVSLSEVLSKGYDYHKRYRMVRKDGKLINVQMNAAAAKDSRGEYIRTICMIDTTEHMPI